MASFASQEGATKEQSHENNSTKGKHQRVLN